MTTLLCHEHSTQDHKSFNDEDGAVPVVARNDPDRDDSDRADNGPSLSSTFLLPAIEMHRVGRFDQAEALYERILLAEPENALCLHHLGLIAHQHGDLATAIARLEQAIRVKPDYVEALTNLAALYRAQGLFSKAIETCRAAIAQDPSHAIAYSNQGGAHEDLGEQEEALACYRKAASLNPAFIEAALNAAHLLRRLQRREEAITACETLIAHRPDAAEPHMVLGNILRDLGRHEAARAAYEQALALRPDYAEAYNNLGNTLHAQAKYEEARKAFIEAIRIKPDFAQAHAGLGVTLESLKRPREAIASFQTALHHDPQMLNLRLWLHHRRRAICDWNHIMEDEAELHRQFVTNTNIGNPFPLISMETSAAEQYRLHRAFGETFGNKQDAFVHVPRPRGTRRLKIGYLSSDFYRHATALLMVELFERHDREAFEIIAYSHGPDDHSELGIRTREAFDRFVDINALSDFEAASLIYSDGIDILIDLKGYTGNARTGILGLRPAPIQVNFLGFPGTMGVDFIDYIIADPIVAPMDQQPFFGERIVHMPHSYQPNDSRRMIADLTPTRSGCGLPEEGFVFCCFNNSYKITPALFDLWMRLLDSVPGSVLWLLEPHPIVRDNLGQEAKKRGIDPSRLVFAPKIAIADHLARHRLADLFIDCLPCNAHTTASDALWAGLPVLTCLGQTFAGRVAASLLQAVGLPELIMTTFEDYEVEALRLARDPAALQTLRRKLLTLRHKAPLFDIALYTRHLERAYQRMWSVFEAGQTPLAFAVEPTHAAEDAKPAEIARIAFKACPLCGGSFSALLTADVSPDPLYRSVLPGQVEWERCHECGHVFAEGAFPDHVQITHFARPLPEEAVGHDLEKQRSLSAAIVTQVMQLLPRAEGSWLDVGFGNGSLLFTAEEWGFVPVGIERRPQHAEILKNLGYEASCGQMAEHGWNEHFSVISLSRTLERVAEPLAELRIARRQLRRDGVLFLSLRNRGSMVWRLLQAGQENPYWGDLRAVHLFDRARVETLLIEVGFQPLSFMIDARFPLGMGILAVRDDSPLLDHE